MNFDSFCESFFNAYTAALPENYIAKIQYVRKNNGTGYKGITAFCAEKTNGIPVLNLEELYREFENGRGIQEMVSEAIKLTAKELKLPFDTSFLFNRDYILENAVFRLVNYEKNIEMLSDKPHRMVLDLAVTYAFFFEAVKGENALAVIGNNMLSKTGITEDELFVHAKENTERLLGEKLMKIASPESDRDNFPEKPGFFFYALTNRTCFYGASVLLYSDKIKALSERLCKDIVIIPSSVHEILLTDEIIPDLKEMIKQINEECVEVSEVLSDNPYIYRRETGEIEIL